MTEEELIPIGVEKDGSIVYIKNMTKEEIKEKLSTVSYPLRRLPKLRLEK